MRDRATWWGADDVMLLLEQDCQVAQKATNQIGADLDRSRSPRNEVGKFSFSYSLKALVHLRSKLHFTSAKKCEQV